MKNLLPPLQGTGLEVALLVDRAGRVVQSRGLDDRGRLRQVASLAAGIHAVGARLSEAVGDPGRSRMILHAGGHRLLLTALPHPSTLLLLLAFPEGSMAAAERLLREVQGWGEEVLPSSPDVADARAFEATLEASLRGLEPEGTEEAEP